MSWTSIKPNLAVGITATALTVVFTLLLIFFNYRPYYDVSDLSKLIVTAMIFPVSFSAILTILYAMAEENPDEITDTVDRLSVGILRGACLTMMYIFMLIIISMFIHVGVLFIQITAFVWMGVVFLLGKKIL
jgi:hypothetical protein